jgi:hypothetical protein
MRYDFIAIPDEEVPQALDPLFQHLVATYASEANKPGSMWRATRFGACGYPLDLEMPCGSTREVLSHRFGSY